MLTAPLRLALSLTLLALWPLPLRAETWTFALVGDTPYSKYERRELPHLLEAIAQENVAFVAHAGDFKHGGALCSDALFEDRRALFDAVAVPFIYVPGDNEWTDCSRLSAGGYAPLERLARLRQLFFADPFSLGRTRLRLERQSAAYPEHQRWRLGPVHFASLNVPGDDNHFGSGEKASAEFQARNPVVLDWLHDSFAVARRERAAAIVLVMQANPDFKSFAAGLGHRGFRALLRALQEETMNFPGQVVLVHGDTHWQRIDHPLRQPESGATLANFTRVETFGHPLMGWIKGIVDTGAPGLLRFEVHPYPPRGSVPGAWMGM